jgi:hypothetical protein
LEILNTFNNKSTFLLQSLFESQRTVESYGNTLENVMEFFFLQKCSHMPLWICLASMAVLDNQGRAAYVRGEVGFARSYAFSASTLTF